MKTRQLGNSDLHITKIGLGAWAIGGGNWAFGWGPQDDADSIACIHEAVDAGINWIDTAPVYGLGYSEEIVTKALKGMAQKPYIFTKCGRIWDDKRQVGKSLKRDSVRRECEASLKRLNIERIDLYQMHWPEPDEDVEEGWETMVKLKEEGKVRWIGVSNFNVSQLKRAERIAPITSLQPPYSLIRPEVGAEVLPYCLKQNIGVIAYSPMGSGLLTGTMTRERIAQFPEDDFRRNSKFYQEPQLSKNLQLAELCKEIGQRHGKNAGEVAIAWVLANPAVTGAIVGARKPGQVAGFIGAMDWQLPESELVGLDGIVS
ncbi:MAG: aldo/keto reductase [Planctomycetia bacterium]|nr:aldo/keto reductase [Planctomycetia bacterium]